MGLKLDRGDEDWYFQTTCPGGIDTCKSPAAGGDFHGTFCAGAAAAELNDSGIIGSCPMCRILPIRFGTTLGDDGESELHDAVYYVRHYVEALGKRAVLSLSFGVSPDTATTFATFFGADPRKLDIAFL